MVHRAGCFLMLVNHRLAYFEREFSFLTQKQLMSEAIRHYAGQAVKQLYVLVLGLDVLGNPYGLVLGITQGVEDLFYEPFQVIISRNCPSYRVNSYFEGSYSRSR